MCRDVRLMNAADSYYGCFGLLTCTAAQTTRRNGGLSGRVNMYDCLAFDHRPPPWEDCFACTLVFLVSKPTPAAAPSNFLSLARGTAGDDACCQAAQPQMLSIFDMYLKHDIGSLILPQDHA